jgi:N-acetylglucosaminyl transferase component (Gpi1)
VLESYRKVETSAQYIQCVLYMLSTPPARTHLQPVRFNNAIWLILNDLILGITLGTFVCRNHVAIAALVVHWIQVRGCMLSGLLVASSK